MLSRLPFPANPAKREDAADLHECGTLDFFWYVRLPLARPALRAMSVLETIKAWNEQFLPLLVFTDESGWRLPLGIRQFQGQFGTDWGLVRAFVSHLINPAVLVYIFIHRSIVTGLAGGEFKG